VKEEHAPKERGSAVHWDRVGVAVHQIDGGREGRSHREESGGRVGECGGLGFGSGGSAVG
jgi:hypothetical protein